MLESYIYYFKRWLFRKGKITHQEAALGILLTLIISGCGYFAINYKPQRLISEPNLTATPISAGQSEASLGPDETEPMPLNQENAALNPDSASIAQPVITASNKSAVAKPTPKRVLKPKYKRISNEALVTKMLREGKSVRQIAKKTGLKKKYIRSIRKRKTCNCKAS